MSHVRIYIGIGLFLLLFSLLSSAGKGFGEAGRFCDHNDGTVTDSLNDLMWTKDADPAADTYDWFRALDAVSQLNANGYCGYHDWRLPNVNELAGLIDRTRYSPALPPGHPFDNVKVWYWTSTTSADYSNHAWRIYLFLGHIDYGHKYHMFNYVWPVRSLRDVPDRIPKTGQDISYYTGDDGALRKGRSWADRRFCDHENGTITDRLSGLMWTKSANLARGKRVWPEAKEFVVRLNAKKYCGYNDWRLPAVEDLRTLIDYSKESPVLPDRHPFLHLVSGIYWSSDLNAKDHDYVWCVDVRNSRVDYYNKINHREYVWPVRGNK
jgi:hypothetical protein